MKKLLNAKQIADHMDVTKQTVFDWINKGWLPAIKVGRTVRIKQDDFEDFLHTYYQGNSRFKSNGKKR